MTVDVHKLQALAKRCRELVQRQPQNRASRDWYRIVNADSGERAELFIYGVIGSDWDPDDVTAASFVRDLRGITAPAVDLHINSPGGLVFDGVAIYSALKNHAATVDVFVDGVAASAASFVAMSGDTVAVEKPAKMMIHDAGGLVLGNADDMREMADLLDELSDTIAGIYADRAGGEVAEWRNRMRSETWFSAEQAVAIGLADRVANDTAASNTTVAAAPSAAVLVTAAVTNQASTPVKDRGSHNLARGGEMTIEEIMAALKAIIDGAEGRTLTDEEVKRYEVLEAELAQKRTEAVKARQHAYEAPVRDDIQAVVHVAPAKQDNGMDKAFENYLRTGMPNADLADLRVTNAQGVGTDAAGGFTVPPGFRVKLVEARKAFGGFGSEAEEFTTDAGNPLEWPSNNDTANEGQITAEGAAVAGGADLVFGTVTLGAFKYTGSGTANAPLKVSVELLQDSAFDVSGLVAGKLGMRIARKQSRDWVVGAGTTLPFGVIHAGLTADVTITGAGITYDQLVDVETALDPAYEQNAQWLMNKATFQILRKLKDTAGRPLILEQAEAGIGQGVRRSLLGFPVIIDQAAPNNDINTKFAALGDFREAYVIRRVQDLVIVVNPFSSAANGQVEYLAWERADGNIQSRPAYAILARGAT